MDPDSRKYQEVLIYHYSGTGNSYRVAVWCAEILHKYKLPSRIIPFSRADCDTVISDSVTTRIILTTPTHGLTAPLGMIRFALRLPGSRNTDALIIATRGGTRIGKFFLSGFAGSAATILHLILSLKGYRVTGTSAVDMPPNWAAVHPSLKQEAIEWIENRAKRKIAGFLSRVLSGKKIFIPLVTQIIGIIFFPVSLLYMFIGRIFMARLFFSSSKCNSCGLCALICPNNAIRMKGGKKPRPRWNWRCENCMRCISYCPVGAINVNPLLGIAVILLADLIPIYRILAAIKNLFPFLSFLYYIPGWLWFWLVILVLISIIYPVFLLINKSTPINKFFCWTSPSYYFHFYHEPETRALDLQERSIYGNK